MVDLGDGVARDPHRPRPAHPRRRERPLGRCAGVGRDVRARVHVRGRPARRRGAARHARPRLSPLPGALGDRRGASAWSRTSTWSRPRRGPRSICARRSPRAQSPSRSWPWPRRICNPSVIALHDARVARHQHHRRVRGRARRAHAAAGRAGRGRGGRAARSRSRGSRSAARRGARPRRRPTSTARSPGSARSPRRRSDPTCTRVATTVVRRARGVRASIRIRTARPPPTCCSCARWSPGAASPAAWIADPTQEKALILVSVLVDSRPVWGLHLGTPDLRHVPRRPGQPRPDAACWPASRSPTGRRRGSCAASSSSTPGEHRGRLDLKHGRDRSRRRPRPLGGDGGGRDQRLRPASGCAPPPTPAPAERRRPHAQRRLRADPRASARAPGPTQLRAGEPPDDYVDPAALSSLTRSHLTRGLSGGGIDPEARRRRHSRRSQVRLRLPSIGVRAPRCESAAAYGRAGLSGRRTRWRDASWCVVDLELSGLDPDEHEIISFGALPVECGRVQLHHAVTGLARPERSLSESSIRVHGIRATDLADAPLLDEAIVPLLETMTGRILVAHAAEVERAFLGSALRRQGVKLRGPIVDTITLARLWLRERDGTSPPSVSLSAAGRTARVARRASARCTRRRAHDRTGIHRARHSPRRRQCTDREQPRPRRPPAQLFGHLRHRAR